MITKTIDNDIWHADIDATGDIDLYIKTPARHNDQTIPLYISHRHYAKHTVDKLLKFYSKSNRFAEIQNEGIMMRIIHEWYRSLTPSKPTNFRSKIANTLRVSGYSDERIKKFLEKELDVTIKHYCVVMTVNMARIDYTLPYLSPRWADQKPYSF